VHRVGCIVRRKVLRLGFYCGDECDQKYIDNQEGWSDDEINRSVMVSFQVELDEERIH